MMADPFPKRQPIILTTKVIIAQYVSCCSVAGWTQMHDTGNLQQNIMTESSVTV